MSNPAETRSLEFTEGSSNKFWTITLTNAAFTVKFGRKGTAGQQQIKEFGSAEEARKVFDKLVAEKLAKGYRDSGIAGEETSKPKAAVELEEAPSSEPPPLLEPPEPTVEPESIRHLRAQVTPGNADVCFQLGKALEAHSSPEEPDLWYTHAAWIGNHPPAYYQLALDCRMFGLKELSRIYLDHALSLGHPDEKNCIGHWHIEDFGFKGDQQGFARKEPQSIKRLRRETDVQDAASCMKLGEKLLTLDPGVARIEALFWFLQAVRLGKTAAHYYIGRLFYRSGNRGFAEFHLEFAADRGHELAAKLLQHVRSNVEPEEITALRKRAERREVEACYYLADALLTYDSNNTAEAFRWYAESARLHHPDGLYIMALYYREHGDISLGAAYLQDAEKQGETQAGYQYRTWQIEGLLPFKDDQEAIGLLEWGVTLGMNIARFRLAELLREDPGPKNYSWRVLKLYEEAAGEGHAPSMLALARCYETGYGVVKNSDTAAKWMKKAADAAPNAGS